MNSMLPVVFLLSKTQDQRSDMADAMLPAIAPVPAPSRVALSAIVADSSIRRHATQAEIVLDQAVSAATTPQLGTDDLGRFDRLTPILTRRPDLRDRLLSVSDDQAKLGDAVVELADALASGAAFNLGSEAAQPLTERLSSGQLTGLKAAVKTASADQAKLGDAVVELAGALGSGTTFDLGSEAGKALANRLSSGQLTKLRAIVKR